MQLLRYIWNGLSVHVFTLFHSLFRLNFSRQKNVSRLLTWNIARNKVCITKIVAFSTFSLPFRWLSSPLTVNKWVKIKQITHWVHYSYLFLTRWYWARCQRFCLGSCLAFGPLSLFGFYRPSFQFPIPYLIA